VASGAQALVVHLVPEVAALVNGDDVVNMLRWRECSAFKTSIPTRSAIAEARPSSAEWESPAKSLAISCPSCGISSFVRCPSALIDSLVVFRFAFIAFAALYESPAAA